MFKAQLLTKPTGLKELHMSTSIALETPTATSPATTRTALDPDPINWGADYRVKLEKAGEVIVSNIKAPIDAPETIRFAWSEISDVFKGSSLKATPGQVTDGISILAQLNCVGINSGQIGSESFPISAHLVLKVPKGMYMDSSDIGVILSRLLGSIYETKDAAFTDRVDAVLRGILTPKDL